LQLSLNKLKNTKNLLAFSAGIDSTALFFLLLENETFFDIAIVDYNQREQSKQEIQYAKDLAQKYNKKCFTTTYNEEKFSEKLARDFRYDFFEQLVNENNYEVLLTAHQLNDKLEWFFMQLSKGAGAVELLGLEEKLQKENYTIYRPLLNYTKQELQEYLDSKNIKYFIDQSNFDEQYKRNHIRHNFSDKFLQEFKNGITKSFSYLQKDKNELLDIEILHHEKDLYIIKNQNSNLKNIRTIDQTLKKLGHLLTSKEKEEICDKKDVVIGHKWVVCITDKIYICPYMQTTIPKEKKEEYRTKKIPSKVRAYIYFLTTYFFNGNGGVLN
jgi:tRNA(Ile)-lysidine synthase